MTQTGIGPAEFSRDKSRVAGAELPPSRSVILRTAVAADLDWIVERHRTLYAEEHGWGASFVAIVSAVIADFNRGHDPRRERCWIAERGADRVGSAMLVRHMDDCAKLRLLLVEPAARGLGMGRMLTDECVAFARAAGYRRITLWTNSALVAARRLYEGVGFHLVHREAEQAFGQGLVSETWQLEL